MPTSDRRLRARRSATTAPITTAEARTLASAPDWPAGRSRVIRYVLSRNPKLSGEEAAAIVDTLHQRPNLWPTEAPRSAA